MTVAGNGVRGFKGDGGPATAAAFYSPSAVAFDILGNMYVADTQNNRIRKVTPAGLISSIAGNGTLGFGGDGGAATAASLSGPYGLAIDAFSNIYIADTQNNRIRRVTSGGTISTFAGNGTAGFSGDGGSSISASLNFPRSIAIDVSGNVFIADTGNRRIRKITPGGIISTVAGNGNEGFSGDGGAATRASLGVTYGVAIDASSNIYIADSGNHRIRKVTSGGVISTVAGNGTVGFSGDGGPATAASLSPVGVTISASGNIYIPDSENNRIWRVTPVGIISIVAGNGIVGLSGDGGPATATSLSYPIAVAFDSTNSIYIADSYNNRIRPLQQNLWGDSGSGSRPKL